MEKSELGEGDSGGREGGNARKQLKPRAMYVCFITRAMITVTLITQLFLINLLLIPRNRPRFPELLIKSV